MSVKIKNSLSNYLEHAMILEKNSIESIQRMHEAVTTGKDSVTLTITDPASVKLKLIIFHHLRD